MNLELVRSSFSGPVTRDAVTARPEIYRPESNRQWVLGVVNRNGTPIVWEDLFNADGAAYEAFEAAVETDGVGTFLDEADTPASSTRH